MVGELEATADLVTGALLSGAVEPEAGSGSGEAISSTSTCANCGAALAGPFCQQCGQKAHVHRALSAFWHDFLHSVLHFEGKVWRTLPMLVFRPGQLTRRYVHGERARFVSPLALFLFSIFLMFSAFTTIGGPLTLQSTTTHNGKVLNTTEMERQLAQDRAQLAQAEAQLAAEHRADDALSEKIDDLNSEISGLSVGHALVNGSLSDVNIDMDTNTKIDTDTRNTVVGRFIKQQTGLFKKNPELLMLKLQESAHKFSWVIIPLSLPFMWLMFFWRRDVKLFDHVVFVTYSLCFVMLLLVFMSVLGRLGSLVYMRQPLLWFGVPAHMFAQLRGAYQLPKWSALWRTVVLIFVSLFVLAVYAVLVLAIGLID